MLKKLLAKFCQVSSRNPNQDIVMEALNRLADESEYLHQSGRHGWVKTRIASLNNISNWPAFCMEIHFTYIFESSGVQCQNGKRLISENVSDVDITVQAANGIEVRLECVYTAEPESFWQEYPSPIPGLPLYVANQSGLEFEALFRKLQNKIRSKTVRDGRPIKFPVPDRSEVHLIAADVTKGVGFPALDRGFREVICWGNHAKLPREQRMRILGLFEPTNRLGAEFDQEYQTNHFLRERIHGIILFTDRSNWESSFNPDYVWNGYWNPNLPLSLDQNQACDPILNTLRKLGNPEKS